MAQQIDTRGLHIGKSPQEKQAYLNFLREDATMEKTVQDEEDPLKTDNSAFEKEETFPQVPQVRGKNILLKLKDGDFLNNPWFVTIVGGIIVSILLFYIVQISISQGILASKMDTLQKDIETSKTNNAVLSSQFHELELKISVAVEGVQKDIQFLKDVLHIN